MQTNISDVLSRRSDLSTFLVHLTRADGNRTASQNLESILRTKRLEARTAMGWCVNAEGLTQQDVHTQRVVCFSETPLDQAHSLFADIAGRRVNMEPYGVAFTKVTARRRGVNPVWYVDKSPGHNWSVSKALGDLRASATSPGGGFSAHPMARIAPFFESMGTWQTGRREFWWEREWRHVGDLGFGYREIALVLCPETEIPQFEGLSLLREFRAVDPRWSLEQMIAHLVGLNADTVTLFGVR